MLTSIQSKSLKIKTAKAGVNILNADDLTIDFVAPNSDKYDDLNDYSAVIKLRYKEKSYLQEMLSLILKAKLQRI